MRCSWTRELLVVAIFITMTFARSLHAQEYRAKITGTVSDSSKAVVPNATVQIHNLDTGEVTTVKTNSAGIYTVPYLHPGQRYDVSVEATGFKTESYPPTTLSIAQILTADFTMHVGASTQEVTVTSENYQVALDTGSGDRGTLIDNKTITQLPLNGRNPLSLLDYIPGVTNEAGPGLETTPNNMYNISFFTFNGNPTQNTEYLIDGMPDNSNPWSKTNSDLGTRNLGPSPLRYTNSSNGTKDRALHLDEFGIENSRMEGYWVPSNPVKTGKKDVLATSYIKEGAVLVAIASWAEKQEHTRLTVDWKALGIDPAKAVLTAPAIENFQEAATYKMNDEIPILPGRGLLLML
jgi:Family of unknown function (DUF6067)/Carboxypeptidase regulatory-like domain